MQAAKGYQGIRKAKGKTIFKDSRKINNNKIK
jgi:hypothetical protein